MSKGRKYEFIHPTGINQISSISLAIARVVLIIYVLRTDPLSAGFGYLLILLFLISVARHFLSYFSEPTSDNIYNFFLDLLTPCLYGFVLYHVLSVYEVGFFSLAVSVFLPGIMYCFLFARESHQVMGKRVFLAGLFCYVSSFLLTLNYSFDLSNPVVERYFLSNKHEVSAGSDYEGYKGVNYYFDLVHIDSIATDAYWVEIDRKTCTHYHNSWMYKTIKMDDGTFMILGKKTATGIKHQCHFLLQKIDGPVYKKITTEQQFAQFEKGDTFNVEKHRGLWGIQWQTYY